MTVIHAHWDDVADAARLAAGERQLVWGRRILNPFLSEDD